MKYIERLKADLGAINGHLSSAKPLGMPEAMTEVLNQIRASFNKTSSNVSEQSISRALSRFKDAGTIMQFIDLKYVCFGIGQPLGHSNWSLIRDQKLFQQLLIQVEAQKLHPGRFRKCYQGLVMSYLGFSFTESNNQENRTNWSLLQAFLGQYLAAAYSVTPRPTWIEVLSKHPELFSERPCKRYVENLISGDGRELNHVAEQLGIPKTSWIMEQSIWEQIRFVCSHRDEEFRRQLNRSLEVLQRRDGFSISDTLQIRCLAELIRRYARSSSQPEHEKLRDAAITRIGNPWLKRAAWDAYVQDESARKMVDGWLKQRLIHDFFTLLADDGTTDPRRLKYWLKAEPIIEDMWFALGSTAGGKSPEKLKEFKKRAAGRLLILDSASPSSNSAFIFRLGTLIAVEFGEVGACFFFDYQNLPFDLENNRVKGTTELDGLKSASYVHRITHKKMQWEREFDNWLTVRVGWSSREGVRGRASARPTSRNASSKTVQTLYENKPASAVRRPAFRGRQVDEQPAIMDFVADERRGLWARFVSEHGLSVIDHRRVGGALWVKTDDSNAKISIALASYGFKYKAEKGWWIKP